MPIGEISRVAQSMGLKLKGNTVIRTILARPAYAGLLHVKAYKDFAEEFVEGVHQPLVSRSEWDKVQTKLHNKNKHRLIINDDMPLRGILNCHCGKPLTGAASTGKSGKKFNYYKCNTQSSHNNISVIKAHDQLSEIWKYFSLKDHVVRAIKKKSQQLLETQLKENNQLFRLKKNEYDKANEELESVEKK